MKRQLERGYTFIEVLVVVALVGVILGFGMIMSTSSIGRSSILSERDLFVSLLLRGARAEAIANADQVAHGVHIDNSTHQYTLFEGTSWSGATSMRTVAYTDPSIRISNTGGNDIIFAQRSGNVSTGAGTITFSKDVQSLVITINSIGQIDW